MQRIHHTKKANIRKEYSVGYKQEMGYKPTGLWYGLGYSWGEWCQSEGFNLENLKNAFTIKLDTSKILLIDSEQKLKAFTEKFGDYPEWMKNAPMKMGDNQKYIDWKKVAEIYSGIEITPYIHECRFTHMWYYGWDVASGCVWNLNAIQFISETSSPK